jgi:hypothetical protein
VHSASEEDPGTDISQALAALQQEVRELRQLLKEAAAARLAEE